MPPKRASTRRSGATPKSGGTLPFSSSPAGLNPVLPSVPIKRSSEYGSLATAQMPRGMSARPSMGLAEMAESIDVGLKNAQNRDLAAAAKTRNTPRNTRSQRKSVSASVSPTRRRARREPTPDQMQLLDSLREVTVSPNPGDNASRPGRSTPTPTPPIPHALSTTSSPAPDFPNYPYLPTNEPLYPSPLQRLGSPTQRNLPLGSSPQQNFNSVDNESVVSWSIERDIHEDDLQRTRSNRFFEEEQRRNITKPPLRPSGFAFAHETIEEEEEPDSRLSIRNPPSPSPSPKPSPRPQSQPGPQPQVQPQPQPQPQPRPEPEPEPELEPEPDRELEPESVLQIEPQPDPQAEPQSSTAPAKTIIPQSSFHETSFRDSFRESLSALSEQSVEIGARSLSNISSFSFRKGPAARTVIMVVFTALSLFTAYFFSDHISSIAHDIGSSLPFGRPTPYIPLDSTGLEAVNSLTRQVSKLGSQVSSLSKEVDLVRSDVDNMPIPTMEVQPIPVRKQTPRINFLTRGMGVLIDPKTTNPTVGKQMKFYQAAYLKLFGSQNHGPQPPLAALTGWEDVGDCWCSAPRNGESQLGILLGTNIVPEEVVVEHIPKGATPNPQLAPRDMELWARFKIVKDEPTTADKPVASDSDSWLSYFSSPEPKESSEMDKLSAPPGQLSLHEAIMSVVGQAYKNEPESAYSDDPLLGDSFYRVGRWTYNLHGENNVQEFSLNAIIDQPDIRVDKVVFRVKNNWGANNTCLYRLKLHGHA